MLCCGHIHLIHQRSLTKPTQFLLLGTGRLQQGARRSSPSKAASGKRVLSAQEPADKSGSRKRQAQDSDQATPEVASQEHQPPTAVHHVPNLANGNGAGAEASTASSEDTQSNGAGPGAIRSEGDQQGKGAATQVEEDLVQKLATNLQMALKALSILKGIDSGVFESLQPADLANLDLRTLCETPSSTPSQ